MGERERKGRKLKTHQRERRKISSEKEWESRRSIFFFVFIIIPLDCPSIQNASVFPSRIKNPVTCNWHGSNYDRLWNNNFFGEGRGTRVSSIKVETDRGGKKRLQETSIRVVVSLYFPNTGKLSLRIIIKKKGGKKKEIERREKERLR